jgi:membrane protease YdiL (CAAX protease family)
MRAGAPARRARHPALGPAVFVALAIALTWAAAWLAAAAPCGDGGDGTAGSLLCASLVYAAVVGWQPLVALAVARRWFADGGELDHGLRPAGERFWGMSVAGPAVLIVAAVGVQVIGHGLGIGAGVSVGAGAGAGAGADGAGGGDGAALLAAIAGFFGAVGVLWLQAICEELAWRGYLLVRLMRRLGAWPGLVLHGALWGLEYAPLFLVGAGASSLGRLAGFVVTCALLGIVFGWLRLASRSVYVSAAANATLTICGGLPFALAGGAPPLAAIYQPAGWLPIAVAVVVIASRAPLRAAVAVPYRPLPDHVS